MHNTVLSILLVLKKAPAKRDWNVLSLGSYWNNNNISSSILFVKVFQHKPKLSVARRS